MIWSYVKAKALYEFLTGIATIVIFIILIIVFKRWQR